MDLIEDKREEITMTGNKKIQIIKQGQIQLKQKNLRKIQVKKSEPSSDKPNPKDMKISLTVPKSDKRSLSSMSRSHEDDSIPRKKQKRKYQNLQSLRLK